MEVTLEHIGVLPLDFVCLIALALLIIGPSTIGVVKVLPGLSLVLAFALFLVMICGGFGEPKKIKSTRLATTHVKEFEKKLDIEIMDSDLLRAELAAAIATWVWLLAPSHS